MKGENQIMTVIPVCIITVRTQEEGSGVTRRCEGGCGAG